MVYDKIALATGSAQINNLPAMLPKISDDDPGFEIAVTDTQLLKNIEAGKREAITRSFIYAGRISSLPLQRDGEHGEVNLTSARPHKVLYLFEKLKR